MKTTKINESEIASLKISSLPTRPTLPSQYGGKGYSASDMKAAFDSLPLFIIERLNSLIDDVSAEPNESIAAKINTGIALIPTLSELFLAVSSGSLADALCVAHGESLNSAILAIKEDIELIKARLGISGVSGS